MLPSIEYKVESTLDSPIEITSAFFVNNTIIYYYNGLKTIEQYGIIYKD